MKTTHTWTVNVQLLKVKALAHTYCYGTSSAERSLISSERQKPFSEKKFHQFFSLKYSIQLIFTFRAKMKNNLLKRCLKLSISVPLPSFITRLLDFSCLFRFSRQLIVFSSRAFKCRQKNIQNNKKPISEKETFFRGENVSKPIMLAWYTYYFCCFAFFKELLTRYK